MWYRYLISDDCFVVAMESSEHTVDICCVIIRLLGSNQWSERKEGLMSLQYYITNIKSLTPHELRRVTEVFTRMFHDPHAKVCCYFLII